MAKNVLDLNLPSYLQLCRLMREPITEFEIISAQPATARERRMYEQGIDN